jgi:hypothetical protein
MSDYTKWERRRTTSGTDRWYLRASLKPCAKHIIFGMAWEDGESNAMVEIRRADEDWTHTKPIKSSQLPADATTLELEDVMQKLHARIHVRVPPRKNRGRS